MLPISSALVLCDCLGLLARPNMGLIWKSFPDLSVDG